MLCLNLLQEKHWFFWWPKNIAINIWFVSMKCFLEANLINSRGNLKLAAYLIWNLRAGKSMFMLLVWFYFKSQHIPKHIKALTLNLNTFSPVYVNRFTFVGIFWKWCVYIHGLNGDASNFCSAKIMKTWS